jgi:hypothetical protein
VIVQREQFRFIKQYPKQTIPKSTQQINEAALRVAFHGVRCDPTWLRID